MFVKKGYSNRLVEETSREPSVPSSFDALENWQGGKSRGIAFRPVSAATSVPPGARAALSPSEAGEATSDKVVSFAKASSERCAMLEALDQHAIVSIADRVGNIIYVNDKFVRVSGYDREELLGQNYRFLKSHTYSAEFYADMHRHLATGQTWQGEIKNIRKCGKPFWVQATIVPILDPEGQPFEFISILTDITDAKVAASYEEQCKTFDYAHEEIYMIRPETLEVFYANRSAERRWIRFKTNKQDISHHLLQPANERSALIDLLRPLIAGVTETLCYAGEIVDADDEHFLGEVTIQMLYPEHAPPRLFARVRDISLSRMAEREKSEFFATVTHELRTPLTSVLAGLGLMPGLLQRDDKASLAKIVALALKNGQRLRELVDGYFELEKMERGYLTVSRTVVDMKQVVNDAMAGIGGDQSKRNIQLHYDEPEGRIQILGDPKRLEQALLHLLSNAYKHSFDDGVVEVELKALEEQVCVSVRDHGSGIPDKSRRRIFEKFMQADMSDTRNHGGSGLGLPLAREIIKQHGGVLDVDCNVKKGSRFRFVLPRISPSDSLGNEPALTVQS